MHPSFAIRRETDEKAAQKFRPIVNNRHTAAPVRRAHSLAGYEFQSGQTTRSVNTLAKLTDRAVPPMWE